MDLGGSWVDLAWMIILRPIDRRLRRRVMGSMAKTTVYMVGTWG